MTIDTVFHDLSNETKAARISDNRGASNAQHTGQHNCPFACGRQQKNIEIFHLDDFSDHKLIMNDY